jgi:hypothetical protein
MRQTQTSSLSTAAGLYVCTYIPTSQSTDITACFTLGFVAQIGPGWSLNVWGTELLEFVRANALSRPAMNATAKQMQPVRQPPGNEVWQGEHGWDEMS